MGVALSEEANVLISILGFSDTSKARRFGKITENQRKKRLGGQIFSGGSSSGGPLRGPQNQLPWPSPSYPSAWLVESPSRAFLFISRITFVPDTIRTRYGA